MNKNFSEFYQELLKKSIQEKGKNFELYFKQIIKEFFSKSPKYKSTIEKVYLWSEWKNNWGQDIGIDLVAQTSDKEFIAIQCKFHTKETKLSKGDLEGLLAVSNKKFNDNGQEKNFTRSYLVTTSQDITTNAEKATENQAISCSIINYNDLLEANIYWDTKKLSSSSLNEELAPYGTFIKEKEQKKLRKYQLQAVESVYKGFTEVEEDEDDEEESEPKIANKGKLVMACGTGKTITALKIIEKLKSKQVLFLVPSLSLLDQTVEEFNQERKTKQKHLIVCSDKTIKTTQETDDLLEEIKIPATTNVEKIKNFLAEETEAIKVIFSTYQSLDKVEEAQKLLISRGGGGGGNFLEENQSISQIKPFDLVICDEAHRTTGAEKGGNWQKIHNEEKIRRKKTLFMTATPRIYKERAKKQAREQALEVFSMDDKEKYGELFHSYYFTQAIREENLSDYKVVILTIPSGEENEDFNFVNHIGKEGVQRDLLNFLKLDKITQKEQKIHIVNSQKILKEEIVTVDKEKINKLICFTNSIKKSKKVQKDLESREDTESDHIDGTMTGNQRKNRISWLRENSNKIKILSNAQCLAEGVNIPSVNGILFAEPKKSQIQVVQAVGRAIRKAEGKKYGYVVLPIIVPIDQNPDSFLNDSNYNHIWQVLKALRTHDKKIGFEIDTIKPPDYTCPQCGEPRPCECPCYQCGEKPCVCVVEQELSFEEKLYLKILEKVGDKKYLENWIGDIEKVGKDLLKKVRKEKKENENFKQAFNRFHSEFKKTINKTITVHNINVMLVQQLLTEPIFQALFPNKNILGNNPIYKEVEKLISYLSFTKKELREGELKDFYQDIKDRVKGLESFEDKQAFLNELYEKFFKKFDSKEAEQKGLVYTPQEIVRFMIRITDDIVYKHFKTNLEDNNINIIDPFTGTGNFIVNILRYFHKNKKLSKKIIQENFLNNLHFNEIMLFPYYIACVNIEYYYQDTTGYEDNFTGAVLVDTFTTLEEKGKTGILEGMGNENTERIEKQKKLPFKVIITNPPYRAGQTRGHSDNQNINYKYLDERIKKTYVKEMLQKGKHMLLDYYIRAFRWASDKIQNTGIIAFISNNQFLNTSSFSGFRISLEKEFSHIYHFDLKGNCRHLSKEDIKKQGQNVFNIMTGVGITILVKNAEAKEQGKINLYRIDDYTTKEQKLEILNNFDSLKDILLKEITPQESIWINPPKKEFKRFVPLGNKELKNSKEEPQGVIFYKYSSGISTSRDIWAYDYGKEDLEVKISSMIKEYNRQLEEAQKVKQEGKVYKLERDIKKIKWSGDLEKVFNKGIEIDYDKEKIRETIYRPFSKQFLYYDKILNNSVYQIPKIFPTQKPRNLILGITGKGQGDFYSLVSSSIPNYFEKEQYFPYYFYHPIEKINKQERLNFGKELDQEIIVNNFGETLIKRENITNWALNYFQEQYKNPSITKWDIFYYCYGILHSEEYKETYKNDLFREIARIPILKTYQDFKKTSDIGKTLADMHANYEEIKPNEEYFEVEEHNLLKKKEELGDRFYRVQKMKLAKKKETQEYFSLVYNENITISHIPKEIDNYKISGRNVLAWLIANYQVKELDNGYIKDPNNYKGSKYIFDLVLKLISLAIESDKLIKQVPKIKNNYL